MSKKLIPLVAAMFVTAASAQLKSAKVLSIENYFECYHVLGLLKIGAQHNGNTTAERAYDELQGDWYLGSYMRFGELKSQNMAANKEIINKIVKMPDAQLHNIKNYCIQFFPRDYK